MGSSNSITTNPVVDMEMNTTYRYIELLTRVNQFIDQYKNDDPNQYNIYTEFTVWFSNLSINELHLIFKGIGIHYMSVVLVLLRDHEENWNSSSRWTKQEYVLFLVKFYMYRLSFWKPIKKYSLVCELEEKEKKHSIYCCPICIESDLPYSHKVTTNCNHSLCVDCLEIYLDSYTGNKPCCSLCRTVISTLSFTDIIYKTKIEDKFIQKDKI